MHFTAVCTCTTSYVGLFFFSEGWGAENFSQIKGASSRNHLSRRRRYNFPYLKRPLEKK